MGAASLRTQWPDERVAELTRLWARGETVPFIAKALKIGAEAITNKADRLGLPKRSAEATSAARSIVNARNARGLSAPPVRQANDGRRNGHGGKKAVLANAKAVARVIVAGNGQVLEASTHTQELGTRFRCTPVTAATLLDLDHGRCKMPVGDLMAFNGADQLFCGAKTRRDKVSPTGALQFQTYCPTHKAEATKLLPGRIKPSERQIVRELRRHI